MNMKRALTAVAGVDARNGERDVIRCGSGEDVVLTDRIDRVARDCERVVR